MTLRRFPRLRSKATLAICLLLISSAGLVHLSIGTEAAGASLPPEPRLLRDINEATADSRIREIYSW